MIFKNIRISEDFYGFLAEWSSHFIILVSPLIIPLPPKTELQSIYGQFPAILYLTVDSLLLAICMISAMIL